jgi:hypothetical protein
MLETCSRVSANCCRESADIGQTNPSIKWIILHHHRHHPLLAQKRVFGNQFLLSTMRIILEASENHAEQAK